MHIAYGYDSEGNTIQEQLEGLEEVYEYISQGMSVREASSYLTQKTDRYISHVGLGKKFKAYVKREQERATEG